MVGERHGMCESALKNRDVPGKSDDSTQIWFRYVVWAVECRAVMVQKYVRL
jgi:hypothetical protein